MNFDIINANGLQGVNRVANSLKSPLGSTRSLPSFARMPSLIGVATKLLAPVDPTSLMSGTPPIIPTKMSATQVDVVGVFDSSYKQIISSARPMGAQVSVVAQPFDHPVENGGVVGDWRVILPIELVLNCYLLPSEYRAAYAAIETVFYGTELLTVQTLTSTYSNMLLTGIPHEEDGKEFDLIPLQLRFKEVTLVKAQFQAMAAKQVPSTPSAQSTINRGEQPAKQSLLFGAANKAGLIVK